MGTRGGQFQVVQRKERAIDHAIVHAPVDRRCSRVKKTVLVLPGGRNATETFRVAAERNGKLRVVVVEN